MHTRLAWLLFALVYLALSVSVLTFDFRVHPAVTGDQASHLFQALSLAHDGDLRFDPHDFARWQQLGWEPIPNGLFFQRYHGGIAFAKPWAYSAWLAPFVRLAGAVRGVALANWVVLTGVLALSAALLRRRLTGPGLPLLLGAVYLASYFHFYAVVIEPAPFHALLAAGVVWLLFRYQTTRRPGVLVACVPLLALAFAEKASLSLLLAPLFLHSLGRPGAPRWRALFWLGVCGLCAVLPCLHYSDWRSLSPYGGDRYYCGNTTPFAEPPAPPPKALQQRPGGALELLREKLGDPANIVLSAYYYFFGAFTGVALFATTSFLLLAGGLLAPPRRGRGVWLALVTGLVLAIGGYLLLYPENYYGGGQAIGNRWFLKMIPAIVGLAVASRLSQRAMIGIALAGLLGGAVFLGREQRHHRHLFARPWEGVSPARRYFPFEANQAMLAPYTGGLNVNLHLYPARPRWRLVTDVEPPLWEWHEGVFTSVPAEKHSGFVFARVRLGPVFQCVRQQAGLALYLAEVRRNPADGSFSSINGGFALTARGGGTHHLLLTGVGNTCEITVTSAGKKRILPLPCVLRFTGGEGEGRLLIFRAAGGDVQGRFVEEGEVAVGGPPVLPLEEAFPPAS